MDPKQALINKILSDPRIASNPNASEWLNVIQTNDAARGEQIANNICASLGISKEQALAQARKTFGL